MTNVFLNSKVGVPFEYVGVKYVAMESYEGCCEACVFNRFHDKSKCPRNVDTLKNRIDCMKVVRKSKDSVYFKTIKK